MPAVALEGCVADETERLGLGWDGVAAIATGYKIDS